MSKRIIGGREFTVTEKIVKLSDISKDTTLQCRADDSPWIRGRDIARAMRDTGATRFRDNILLAYLNGELVILDGYGRVASAVELGWTEIHADVLGKRAKEDDLLFIALAANHGQVSQRPFTAKELQEAAYRFHAEVGLDYAEIARIQEVGIDTVKHRVLRGQQIREARLASNKLTKLEVFNGTPAAKGGALKVLNAAFKLKCEGYLELCNVLRDDFNIELRMFVGGNEKQVKGLVYELLANEEEGKPTNFLVLFYLQKVGDNTGSAWRMAERISALRRIQGLGRFHFTDLSADTSCFGTPDVRAFAEQCRLKRAAAA